MSLTLARADKEVAQFRPQIRERNTLKLKVTRLEKERKEGTRQLSIAEEAQVEAKRKKVEEVGSASAEAVEKYKESNEFRDLVLEGMVEE